MNRPGARVLALLSAVAPGITVGVGNQKPYRAYAKRYAKLRGRPQT